MKNVYNLGLKAVRTVILIGCVGLSARADFPTTLQSQGPVGYWRLNESIQPPAPRPAANAGSLGAAAEGQYLLGPRRGEPGALAGTADTSVKFFNPNLDVALGGSKVEVPFNAALNPNGPFSVEFWAKPSMLVTDVFCLAASIDSDPALSSRTNANPRAGWLFYQAGSATNGAANQWQFRLGNATDYIDGNAIRGGTVSTGLWHHIVGTFDGAKASLYVNGVEVASHAAPGYQANDARPLRIGTTTFDGGLGPIGTFAGNRGFDGWMEEVALYGAALSAADIAAHYNAGKTNGAGYASLVLANHPMGYWRLGEPGNPPAKNLGTLAGAADGRYIYSAHPGQAGPQAPTFAGFEGDNRGCGFAGTNGFVDLPPLNLNTDTVTITAWILANSIQTEDAGIVFSRSGTTVAGLKFDVNDPNGLSYNWNNDTSAANFKSGLAVPVFQWCFVALMVRPDQATLCLQDGTQFLPAVNYTVHPRQAFEGDTLIGRDAQDPSLTFNGIIDEVAIFNRALTVGEVYSQYASAVGEVKPSIFADVQAPAETLYLGDRLSLIVDAGGTPPLSYQWRKDGLPIAGATSSAFSKGPLDAADAGSYDVVISNPTGSVTSAAAKIAVQQLSAPSIDQGPQGRSVYVGGSVNFAVQATGGGLSYQWQKDSVNVAGATNAALRIDRATAGDAGVYQAVVSNRLNVARSEVATLSVIVPTPGSYEETVLQDGPESWWRLDEAPGAVTLTDAMGRHDGVYKGGVTLGVPGVVAGNTNKAAAFDGSSGYAEVPFSRSLNTTNFTIECWVKANPVGAAQSPVASFTQPPGRGYLLQKSEDGLWFYMFGDGVDTAILLISGSDAIYSKWTHLALTFDGTDFAAYLNGVLDALASPTVVPNNVAPLRIGFDQTSGGWNDYWDGEIDEVAFYPHALTEGQIAAHYAGALYGPKSKPLLTRQPTSSSVVVGSQFFFNPAVEGSVPLQLQWTKNGVPLLDETNSFIFLRSVSFQDTGIYQLMATNGSGFSSSEPATLTVLPKPGFANVTNDLVLHLNFDGDYQDSSGRSNDGRPIGSPTFVAGIIGSKALHYRTATDTSDPNNPVVTAASYVTLDDPVDLHFGSNVNFSVSYWVRFTGTPGDLPFFGNSVNAYSNPGYTFAPSYQLGGWSWSLGDVPTSNYIGIYGEDSSINDGSWHHLAHTFDRAGSGITYLDGDEVDFRSIVPPTDLNTGESTIIGQDPSGFYPEEAEVDIDDLGVWRRVLTPFEVFAIYLVGQEGSSFDTYGPVSLIATSDAGAVQLAWQAGTLLESAEVGGPWTPVPGAVPPYHQIPPGSVHKFYRVRL